MARFSFTLSQMATRGGFRDVCNKSAVRTEGIYLTDTSENNDLAKVGYVCKHLLRNRAAPITEDYRPGNFSLLALNAIGITILDNELNNKNYSLITTQIDTEIVDNPNKIDNVQFSKLTKTKLALNDVFKNSNDAIFTVDTNKTNSNNPAPSQTPMPQLQKVAATFIDVNSNNSIPQLRAFGALNSEQ